MAQYRDNEMAITIIIIVVVNFYQFPPRNGYSFFASADFSSSYAYTQESPEAVFCLSGVFASPFDDAGELDE